MQRDLVNHAQGRALRAAAATAAAAAEASAFSAARREARVVRERTAGDEEESVHF